MAALDRTDREVVIVGAGPTGLMLAGELALADVDVLVLEKRPDLKIVGHRAGGLHARSIEILDQRGIAERFLEIGQKAQIAGFAGVPFDISEFPTRHPYGLGIWQPKIERLLAEWVEALGVVVARGIEVEGIDDAGGSVELALSGHGRVSASYLVGCDGARSIVRREAGIGFEGTDATISHLIAEVEMDQSPEFGVHTNPYGIHAFNRADYEIIDGKIHYAESGPIGVMLTEAQLGPTTSPSMDELKAALVNVCGTDFGITHAHWISRFTDAAKQATQYRKGRVLVAGDAAHVHPPDGGQGLNLGLQDATNLGWKLAQVVKGRSPYTLLDTYHEERHPIGARVLAHTLAAVGLRRPDPRSTAAREVLARALQFEEPRTALAAMMSGLDVTYVDPVDGSSSEAHPMIGRRVPDLDIVTSGGPTRIHALLRKARPVLLSFAGDTDLGQHEGRLDFVAARTSASWVLPVIGVVPSPPALLIRPDGYVAWVGHPSDARLQRCLAYWFGS